VLGDTWPWPSRRIAGIIFWAVILRPVVQVRVAVVDQGMRRIVAVVMNRAPSVITVA